MIRRNRTAVLSALTAALVLPAPAAPLVHEVPASVTVLAFLRPEADVLRLLVRVPLESLRDLELGLRGPGYLTFDERLDAEVREGVRLWVVDYIQIEEDGRPVGQPRIAALRVALPSERSFTDWESALAGVHRPQLPPDTELPWQQALVDALVEYPITNVGARFSIRPALAHLGIRTTTVLRFTPPDGAERLFRYEGDPGLVHLDPRWFQAFGSFTRLGFLHILEGLDHLLFLLCLVIPIRRLVPLIAIATAFTVAHSITLAASALGFAPDALWFPPLIETLIALSIVWMAFENIVAVTRERRDGDEAAANTWIERRWLVAFVFGLVHGFGFSFLLRESLQFAGSHLAMALLAFNAGVELGQILVLAVTVPILGLLFRRVVPERIGAILLSALVAHTAWHWMTGRGSQLLAFDWTWPALDVAFALGLVRAALLATVAVAAAWGLSWLVKRFGSGQRGTDHGDGDGDELIGTATAGS